MSRSRTKTSTARLVAGGTLLANAVPHGVKGATGQRVATTRDRLTVAVGATGMAVLLASYFDAIKGER